MVGRIALSAISEERLLPVAEKSLIEFRLPPWTGSLSTPESHLEICENSRRGD